MIRIALVAVTLVLAYWFLIRPVLLTKPAFKEYIDEADSFWGALRGKLSGIKQSLAGSGMIAISAIIEMYDNIAPALGAVDTTPLTSLVPPWAWPVIAISGIALLNYFRKLSDQRNAIAADVTGEPVVKAG